MIFNEILDIRSHEEWTWKIQNWNIFPVLFLDAESI